jgi:hypothetical protein
MSLRTGTALILLLHLINKVTAVYGILALFTSYPLSALQLSMYIYSLPVLCATVYLWPHVRAQSPWQCLAFAYLYTLDSVVNFIYTSIFAVSWFVVLASDAPTAKMMLETGGFASPKHNVSHVDVVAAPKAGLAAAQDAIAVGSGAPTASSGLAGAVLNASTMMSLFIICAFWLLRIYAVFVVIAYARQVLRHHIQVASMSNLNGWSSTKADDLAENPFAESQPQGEGIKGKMGRLMVNFGRSYWLGRDAESDVYLRSMANKFRRSEDVAGVSERERRRRSGTGPPAPPPGLTTMAA